MIGGMTGLFKDNPFRSDIGTPPKRKKRKSSGEQPPEEPARNSWDKRLQCRVISLAYDFTSRRGLLYMHDGDCCNMMPCVNLFLGIDPEVAAIDTFSGENPDTVYRKEDGEWHAFLRKT